MKKRVKGVIAMIAVACMMHSLAACGGTGDLGETCSKAFRVSMAKVDITPLTDVYLRGYEEPNEFTLAVHPDDFTSNLMARMLIVDNGEDRLVFVNLELVFSDAGIQYPMYTQKLVKRIADICQTKTQNVIFSNTHNHQAMLSLTKANEDKIIEAVTAAYNNLAPASIGTEIVNTAFGVGRGHDYTINKDGPYDSRMTVIRFDNAKTKQPIGVVYSVPIHNTMYGNGPDNAVHHNQLSCEFTGYASRFLETKMNDQNKDFTAMHINGFTGSAGPIYQDKYYAGTVDELQKAGAAFGQEILACYENIQVGATGGDISAKMTMGSLPTNTTDRRFAEYLGDLAQLPLVITTGSFGDTVFIGANYEPFSIIGARLKAESPYHNVLPAGSVGGWHGYIPTKEAFSSKQTEQECQPWKTAFTAKTEGLFYSQMLDAVCELAGVSIERTEGNASAPVTQNNAGVYTFDYGKTLSPDKLVIDFGQQARSDCASDFDLKLYDESGKEVFTQTFENNSVNYLGVFLNKVRFSSARLFVRSRYLVGTDKLTEMSPTVYGIQFTPITKT